MKIRNADRLYKKIFIYGYRYTVTGHIYVGSTNNLEHRQKGHLQGLVADKHHCKALQKLWNDVLGHSFEWLLLEEIKDATAPMRNDVETRWIQSFGDLSLNSKKTASGWMHSPHTPESKKKMGLSIKQMYNDKPYLRKALSERLKKINPGSGGNKKRWAKPGAKERYSAKMKAYWSVEEHRLKHAERGRQKNAMHDPAVRQKWYDIVHSKEYAEKQSRDLREKRWSKLENRIRYGKAMKAHWGDPIKKSETLEKRRVTRLRNKNLEALARAKATVEACIKVIENTGTL